jgi:hypothetical protein
VHRLARILRTFGFAAAYLFAVVAVLVLSGLLERYLNPGLLLVFLTILLGNILVCAIALCIRRKTSHRWIKEEAEPWLFECAQLKEVPTWRRKLFRRMIWTPFATVLVVFLFFPESAGITSHLLYGRSTYIAPCRLRTPLTWMVAHKSHYLWLIAAKGLARTGLTLYWDQPISSMVLYPVSYAREEMRIPGPPATAKVLSKHTVSFAKGRFTCWDIIPFAYTRRDLPDLNSAQIECSTSNGDFFATYDGPRFNSEAFYQVLQTVDRDD